MKLLFSAALLVLSFDAMACTYLSRGDQERQDRADLQKQKALARELARGSDAIFVAKAVSVAESRDRATFLVLRTLKGNAPSSKEATFRLSDEITIGCTASVSFMDAHAVMGRKYVLYVADGKLQRSADVRRAYGEISYAEELRQIAKALVPNKTMEPTR